MEKTNKKVAGKKRGVRFVHIEQSYAVMQQLLLSLFPTDAEAAYAEMLDLYEDDWQEMQRRRQSLHEQAEQFKLLYIEGLRTRDDEQEQSTWRTRMLYRLAALFELAAVIDPTAVESLASKMGVSYEQGVACAVLKAQAEGSFVSRQQIEKDLIGLDAWWHNPQLQLSQRVSLLLDTPVLFSTEFVEKYTSIEEF